MGKRIYLLQNIDDFEQFIDFLYVLDVNIYKKNCEKPLSIENVKHQMLGQRYLVYAKDMQPIYEHMEQPNEFQILEDSEYIEFFTCFKTESFMNAGHICLNDKNYKRDPQNKLKLLYEQLAKYIKKEYMISDNKSVYVGKSFYNDWVNYKVSVIDSIQTLTLKFGEPQINLSRFFSYLKNKGYYIESQENDIRSNFTLNDSIGIFFIYFDKKNVIQKIRARKKFFTVDSEGCFLYKAMVIKRTYNIIQFDKRLMDGTHPNIERLYTDILNFMNKEYKLSSEGIYI